MYRKKTCIASIRMNQGRRKPCQQAIRFRIKQIKFPQKKHNKAARKDKSPRMVPGSDDKSSMLTSSSVHIATNVDNPRNIFFISHASFFKQRDYKS